MFILLFIATICFYILLLFKLFQNEYEKTIIRASVFLIKMFYI